MFKFRLSKEYRDRKKELRDVLKGVHPTHQPELDLKLSDKIDGTNSFKLIKARRGMAIGEFRQITIYKCCICGKEIECGDKVVTFTKEQSFQLGHNPTVTCHLKCVKRLPNIITDMFNAVVADKI